MSKIETIFSVIKRRYGLVLRAKNDLTQRRELHQKVLTYNLDRLCKIIKSVILGCHTREGEFTYKTSAK